MSVFSLVSWPLCCTFCRNPDHRCLSFFQSLDIFSKYVFNFIHSPACTNFVPERRRAIRVILLYRVQHGFSRLFCRLQISNSTRKMNSLSCSDADRCNQLEKWLCLRCQMIVARCLRIPLSFPLLPSASLYFSAFFRGFWWLLWCEALFRSVLLGVPFGGFLLSTTKYDQQKLIRFLSGSRWYFPTLSTSHSIFQMCRRFL